MTTRHIVASTGGRDKAAGNIGFGVIGAGRFKLHLQQHGCALVRGTRNKFSLITIKHGV